MEATKATVAIANGLMDQKRFDDVVKIGGKAIEAAGGLVTGNVEGAIAGTVSVVSDGVSVLVKNGDFIGNELARMKKWDETHNKDGSLKSPKLIILLI